MGLGREGGCFAEDEIDQGGSHVDAGVDGGDAPALGADDEVESQEEESESKTVPTNGGWWRVLRL